MPRYSKTDCPECASRQVGAPPSSTSCATCESRLCSECSRHVEDKGKLCKRCQSVQVRTVKKPGRKSKEADPEPSEAPQAPPAAPITPPAAPVAALPEKRPGFAVRPAEAPAPTAFTTVEPEEEEVPKHKPKPYKKLLEQKSPEPTFMSILNDMDREVKENLAVFDDMIEQFSNFQKVNTAADWYKAGKSVEAAEEIEEEVEEKLDRRAKQLDTYIKARKKRIKKLRRYKKPSTPKVGI